MQVIPEEICGNLPAELLVRFQSRITGRAQVHVTLSIIVVDYVAIAIVNYLPLKGEAS